MTTVDKVNRSIGEAEQLEEKVITGDWPGIDKDNVSAKYATVKVSSQNKAGKRTGNEVWSGGHLANALQTRTVSRS